MTSEVLIWIMGLAIGFAIAWMLGSRTREQLAETKARGEAQAQAAADKLELVADARSSLTDAFKALSMEALDTTNERFLKLANASLEKFQERAKGDLAAREQAVEHLVQPIRESLAHVDGKIGELEKARVHAYARLDEQLRGLVETQLPMLRAGAEKLERALRQPIERGQWGELQLRNVVEMAGMVEYCDFVEQQTVAGEEGRVRPDLIVRLPGGRRVAIDAKAPLTARLDAAEAADDDERAAYQRRHAALVRTHMTALGRKSYWEALGAGPELVVLFLPSEALFNDALRGDPELIGLGVNEKVLLAGPITLIALLRSFALGWREDALALNAQQVGDLGREVYERVAKLAEHWGEVGDRLGKAVESYNKGVGTLESRVLVTARRFQDLKAAPEGVEIEGPAPVDARPKAFQAPELIPVENGPPLDRIARIG